LFPLDLFSQLDPTFTIPSAFGRSKPGPELGKPSNSTLVAEL
jgi:hypothetical protein